jgi:hypothetical protein
MAEPDNGLRPEDRSAAMSHAIAWAAVLLPMKVPQREAVMKHVRYILAMAEEPNGTSA